MVYFAEAVRWLSRFDVLSSFWKATTIYLVYKLLIVEAVDRNGRLPQSGSVCNGEHVLTGYYIMQGESNKYMQIHSLHRRTVYNTQTCPSV